MDWEAEKRRSAGQLLFKCARLLNERAIERVRQDTGLPIRLAHTALFPHVKIPEGSRLTDVAHRLGVTKQAVAPLVDELVHMGMMERVPDPDDGRAKLIRWVGGQDALADGLGRLMSLEAELAAEVGEESWAAMHEALLRLEGVLEGGE